jgi:outer membrane receptor protein involved in Fe transport
MKKYPWLLAMHCLLPLALSAKVTVVDSVEVEDDAEKDKQSLSMQAGAQPAQTYVITSEDIKKMNVNTHLDLFRKLPGMITQHYGQGAIADGFGMRGFSSGHGAQIGVWVDGVPINSPHHPHTHGFNDFDWITPDMIDHIEVIKGPFSAFYGNFAQAGVINIVTKKTVAGSSVNLAGGAYKMGQGSFVLGSRAWQPVTPFVVFESKYFQGYRENQDYTRFNSFTKFSFDAPGGLVSVRAHYVDRDWNAPGYLYRPQLDSGLLDPAKSAFVKDGGNSKYYDLVLNYSPKQGEKGLHATLYGVHEELNRFQTGGQLRTNSVPNSGANTQTQEHNDRNFYGGSLLYNWIRDRWSLAAGVDGRYDIGTPQRFRVADRILNAANPYIRNWEIEEINSGLFAQAQYKPISMLKLVLGGRLDYFHADVTNYLVPEHSGEGDFLVPTPKAGLVLSPLPWLDLFTNYGQGYRTPAATEMSPETRTNRVSNFEVEPTFFNSFDLGFSSRILDIGLLSMNGYYMLSDGEIRVDPNTYEAVNVGETERKGVESEFRVYLPRHVSVYGGYEHVQAEVLNAPPVSGAVTRPAIYLGIPENYFNLGFDWATRLGGQPFDIDLHWQMLGETRFNPTSTSLDPTAYYVREAVHRFNLKSNYRLGRVDFAVGATWIPDGDVVNEQSSELSIDPKPIWDFNTGLTYRF